MNRYAYVADDPETMTDPTGHKKACLDGEWCGGSPGGSGGTVGGGQCSEDLGNCNPSGAGGGTGVAHNPCMIPENCHHQGSGSGQNQTSEDSGDPHKPPTQQQVHQEQDIAQSAVTFFHWANQLLTWLSILFGVATAGAGFLAAINFQDPPVALFWARMAWLGFQITAGLASLASEASALEEDFKNQKDFSYDGIQALEKQTAQDTLGNIGLVHLGGSLSRIM